MALMADTTSAGTRRPACYVYAENPARLVQGRSRCGACAYQGARLGTSLHGACIGVSLTTDADVSVVPNAEGESLGFRDARIERLSESKELNFLLEPFLSRKLPSEMKVNAAEMMSKLLVQSVATTGYTLTLDSLKLHSMLVDHNALVVDVDAAMRVE